HRYTAYPAEPGPVVWREQFRRNHRPPRRASPSWTSRQARGGGIHGGLSGLRPGGLCYRRRLPGRWRPDWRGDRILKNNGGKSREREMRIGFLGAGKMGLPICWNIARKAERPVLVHDLQPPNLPPEAQADAHLLRFAADMAE